MTLIDKALFWAAAIILAAFAGAVHWIDAKTALLLISTLPGLAVVDLGSAAARERRCTTKEL